MGVDTSVTVGVGFKVDSEKLKSWWLNETGHTEDYYAGDNEAMELLLKGNEDGLSFSTGGSYYDSSEPITQVVCVNRLTQHYNAYDIPGGVFGIGRPVLFLPETIALDRIADKLDQPDYTVGQFLAVLWH